MNMMTAYSTEESIQKAVDSMKQQFGDFDLKMIIFFSSPTFNPSELSKAMVDTFSGVNIFGCTTSGEIVSGSMLNNSVVAMAFNSQAIADVKIEVIENLREHIHLKPTIESLEKYYHTPLSSMDYKEYVGIVLIDGLSGAEEKLMDMIGDATNVTVVGGSAGDNLKFETTFVFANGNAYTDAAVLALIKPNVEFEIIKTQSFSVLDKELIATKVDEEKRQVIEFNGKPAVEAYSEAIGTTSKDVSDYFMEFPVGLVIDEQPFVRSPQQTHGESMVFYCNVKEGMNVSLLQSTNIIEDTAHAIKKTEEELGGISGIINFNCILRTLELQKEGTTKEYGEIFTNIPTVGFSTYGEQFIGHINQTATMLVFK